MSQSRVDFVQANYFRSGKCAHCGKNNVERSRTFTGTTLEACKAQAERWMKRALLHKKCEPYYLGEDY